tara:strand:+ start:807 stop:1334 length:528 start_codon:yes stop_codon:yes gene_type:complete
MPYTLPQGFQIGNTDPVDSRITVADATARKGFSVNNVFEGLIVYQQDTDELYVLTDPANVSQDSAWTEIGSGGGTNITNPGDNRVLTSDGTSTGILAEEHMLFTGSLLSISSSIEITGSTGTTPFIIKLDDGNGQAEKIKVNNEGVLTLGNLNTAPTAITGGLYYSNGSFYMGIE